MREDIHILSEEEIQEKLKELEGWEVRDNKITKEFKLENFVASVYFVRRLTPFFEKNNHHPDIHISYSRVRFELQRYDVGGKITDLDFKTAYEIERVYKSFI